MTLLPFIYATRNLGRNPLRLALTVGGSTLVSLLALSGEAFVAGMDRAFVATGLDSNVLIIGTGSEESLERSEVPAGAASEAIASITGIRTVAGIPWASPEVHVALPVFVDGDGSASTETSADLGVIRGVTGTAYSVHPQVRMSAGRAPNRGADEVAVGATALRRIGLEPDTIRNVLDAQQPFHIRVDGRRQRVVGVFEAPGTMMDGEVWMPLQDLLVHSQRSTLSVVVISLDQASASDVELFAQRRPDLEIVSIPEVTYYSALGQFFRPVQVMVLASAALVGLGGLLGGLNTMYAAFAARIRETASLQTLGFSRSAIAISMVQEALLATLSGALIAIVLGLVVLRGVSVRFSMGSFDLLVDHRAVFAALASGVLVGLLGAALPALRCLRTPIPIALRAD